MATHQVFGQLEAAVTALPSDYKGKDGYMAWIKDARAKYASPPDDVDGYITGLKAAGTALREKGAVPAVPVAAPAAAASGDAGAAGDTRGLAAALGRGEEVGVEAAPPPTLLRNLDGSVVGSNPVAAAAKAAAPAAPAPAAGPAAAASAAQAAASGDADAAAQAAAGPAASAADAAPAASAADAADAASEAAAASGAADILNRAAANDRALRQSKEIAIDAANQVLNDEGGRRRKTHHQTPKRRRSAKSKGRKKLSKKKTGSRK